MIKKYSSLLNKVCIKYEFLAPLIISLATYILFFGQFLLPNYYFWGSDAQVEYIPARVYFYEKIFQEHSFPFWTEKMYLGFPIYADAENGYLNPINILSILIFGPHLSYRVLHLGFYILGSLSIFYWLKRKQPGLAGFTAANVIYYFNVFVINHQIHFNIILSMYLLPVGILLIDLYLEKARLKYILFLSLIPSFAILYGHIQTAVIISFGLGLYYVVFAGKDFFKRTTISFLILLTLSVFIQSMPQILPSRELFNQSNRSLVLDLYQGSYLPQMFSFLFLPYMFGDVKNYFGDEVQSSFSYTEIYTYIGLSVFIIYLLSIIFNKIKRIDVYTYLALLAFIVLSMLRYNRFFDSETPIIGLFRYWERFFIVLSFGISLSVGSFINNLENLDFKGFWKRIWLFIPPIALLYYTLSKVTQNGYSLNRINNVLSWGSLTINKNFKILVILFIAVLVIFIVSSFKKYFPRIKIINYLNYGLSFIILCDLFFFSFDVTAYRLKDVSNYQLPNFTDSPEKERAAHFKFTLRGMEFLYFKSWTPYGYSQFVESEYMQHMLDRGFPVLNGSLRVVPNDDKLRELGITNTYVFEDSNKYKFRKIEYTKVDLFPKTTSPINYIIKDEGHFVFEINSPEGENLNTLVKFSPSWKAYINGKEVVTDRKDIFLKIYVPQGKSTVELQYVPESFYKGLVVSLILTIIFIPLVWAFRRFKFLE